MEKTIKLGIEIKKEELTFLFRWGRDGMDSILLPPISAIKEDATNAVSQVIECLVPERARLTLWSTVPPPGTQQRRDANLSLDFGELPLERSLQQTWLANKEVPVEWWLAPPLNIYLSKATKIRKRAAEPDPMIPEAIKSKKGHTESDQRGVGILFWTFFLLHFH